MSPRRLTARTIPLVLVAGLALSFASGAEVRVIAVVRAA
jgi:hypothetical protein